MIVRDYKLMEKTCEVQGRPWRRTTGRPGRILEKCPAPQKGEAVPRNTVDSEDLLTSTVVRWKEYPEDLLKPSVTSSVEEAEVEDPDVDSSIPG